MAIYNLFAKSRSERSMILEGDKWLSNTQNNTKYRTVTEEYHLEKCGVCRISYKWT